MTRLSKLTAILLLGAGVSLFAADATATTNADRAAQTQKSANTHQNVSVNDKMIGVRAQAGGGINVEVQKILQADPSERRALMNQFKTRLATMNQKERMEAIAQLKSAMRAEGMHRARMHRQEGAQTGMKTAHRGTAGMTYGHDTMHEGAGKSEMGSMIRGKIAGDPMSVTAPRATVGSSRHNHGAHLGGNAAVMHQTRVSGMPTMVSQNGAASRQTRPLQHAPAVRPSVGISQTVPNTAAQSGMPSVPRTNGRSHVNGVVGMHGMERR